MEMSYINKDEDRYMDICIGGRELIRGNGNEYKLRMLEENSLGDMIAPVFREIDGQIYLRYNINGLYSLAKLLEGRRLDGNILAEVINTLSRCVNGIKEYLLDVDDIILRPEYIMYDINANTFRLIYVPDYKRNMKLQIREFLECVMRSFEHSDYNGISYMYMLYDMSMDESIELRQLLKNDIYTYKAGMYNQYSQLQGQNDGMVMEQAGIQAVGVGISSGNAGAVSVGTSSGNAGAVSTGMSYMLNTDSQSAPSAADRRGSYFLDGEKEVGGEIKNSSGFISKITDFFVGLFHEADEL